MPSPGVRAECVPFALSQLDLWALGVRDRGRPCHHFRGVPKMVPARVSRGDDLAQMGVCGVCTPLGGFNPRPLGSPAYAVVSRSRSRHGNVSRLLAFNPSHARRAVDKPGVRLSSVPGNDQKAMTRLANVVELASHCFPLISVIEGDRGLFAAATNVNGCIHPGTLAIPSAAVYTSLAG
jgi:hypothetical protein